MKYFFIVLFIFFLSCNTSQTFHTSKIDYSTKYPKESAVILSKTVEIILEKGSDQSLKIRKRTTVRGQVLKPNKFSAYNVIPYSKNSETIHIRNIKVSNDNKSFKQVKEIHTKNRLTSSFYSSEMAKTFTLPEIKKGTYYEISYDKVYIKNHYLDPIFFLDDHPIEKYVVKFRNEFGSKIELKTTGKESMVRLENYKNIISSSEKEHTFFAKNVPSNKILKNHLNPIRKQPIVHIFINDKSVLNSWVDISNFFFRTNKKNYTISDENYNTIINSIGTQQSDDAFIQGLFKYVQKYIRYESLSEGVKAYQAYTPDEVMKTKYGDCKDVTMLMISVLKRKGIVAYPAILDSDKSSYNFTLPKLYMANHVIAYVQTKQRSYWLDATSSYSGANELLYSNSNKNCVLVKGENNYEYLKTPEYSFSKDFLRWNFYFDIVNNDLNGNAELFVSGEKARAFRSLLLNTSTADKMRLLKLQLSEFFENSLISDISVKNANDFTKSLQITFRISYLNSVSKLTDGLLISPNPVKHLKQTSYTTVQYKGDLPQSPPFEESVSIQIKKLSPYKLKNKFTKKTINSHGISASFDFIKNKNVYLFKIKKYTDKDFIEKKELGLFLKKRREVKTLFGKKFKLEGKN